MESVKVLLAIVLIGLWAYLLTVLNRSKLQFWYYLTGCVGLFLALMILLRPVLTMSLARAVAAIAGVFGRITGSFIAYFRYGVIFINSPTGAITLKIDLECSGIIEIAAFLSLLAFFRVYTIPERVIVGISGTAYIMMTNALRITIICLIIHFAGTDWYFSAHTFVGRFVFYILQVLLYFYVFTRAQIIRTRLGRFSYSRKEASA